MENLDDYSLSFNPEQFTQLSIVQFLTIASNVHATKIGQAEILSILKKTTLEEELAQLNKEAASFRERALKDMIVDFGQKNK